MHNENNYDTFSLCAEVSLLIPINYSPQIHILNLLHSACICTLHTTLSQRFKNQEALTLEPIFYQSNIEFSHMLIYKLL